MNKDVFIKKMNKIGYRVSHSKKSNSIYFKNKNGFEIRVSDHINALTTEDVSFNKNEYRAALLRARAEEGIFPFTFILWLKETLKNIKFEWKYGRTSFIAKLSHKVYVLTH